MFELFEQVSFFPTKRLPGCLLIISVIVTLFAMLQGCRSTLSSPTYAPPESVLQNGVWIDDDTFRITAFGAPLRELTDRKQRRASSKAASCKMAQRMIIEKFAEHLRLGARVAGTVRWDYSGLNKAIRKEFGETVNRGEIINYIFEEDISCEIVYEVKEKGLKKRLQSFHFQPFMFVGAGALSESGIGAQKKTYGRTDKIGERGPAGGWIFYDKGNTSGGWRYLEAAPEDQGRAEWGCYVSSIPGAQGTAIGTGKSNTRAIIEACGKSNTAAKKCTAYRGGGKSDWFLPSKDELDLMHVNLHKAGVGGFSDVFYWSSSELGDNYVWLQLFFNGIVIVSDKFDTKRVRAVRAF